ncbi:maltose alpha-D-glucosyltransferase [Desulfopila inferna]|uniref:maltose alpha-D-glucosyltransferase n=1 Tax=Desulfopila inferna TaxID=468528 RepID=UPI00196431C0|nr:maltose alpha-D-glucosyltransferase [Desulfopila inferna]MBM9604855.1 maltose alpha-D-glucosyltransferase [Desulfopila inferna]
MRHTTNLHKEPLWYKDAIIYQLHIKAFHDSNGDGIGDFRGLKEKLGYLQELGVNTLWLLPFYPSPFRDDGYDISDFKGIHPSYGTLADFRAFLREAHRRNMRVITELVINHTSDQHPWFQRARRAKPGSIYRDFYVWSDTYKKYTDARIIFQDFESSNWTWDEVAQAYFWHRFYSHQPDLNYDNPRVHKAIFQALDFWMDMGVDGMRLDAIPYLYQREGTNCENLPETHAFLKKLRARMDEKYEGRMFLAEANQWSEDAVEYFGDGDECHMSFHFPLMPRLYMALHMENSFPIIEILSQTPDIPETCQWAIFLRNHDELTLEMVTDEERDYMYRAYAQDPRMRVNLGIRRRLAPLVGNHRRRIELMNGLLFSLPGTPIIYYGDEIGMGDNIYLGDRNGVRTPMQWSSDRNAGFSRTNPQQLYLPVILDPEYHYEVVNVESQKKNRHSLFWWIRRLLTLRSRIPAFSRGNLKFLEPDNTKILVFIRQYQEQRILVVINLSRFVQFVELDLSEYAGMIPVEIFGNTNFPKISEEQYFLTLSPHAFYWFNLESEEAKQDEKVPSPERLGLFQVEKSWHEIFEGRLPARFEKLIPAYIRKQRWFGAKSRRIKNSAVREILPLRDRTLVGIILFIDLQYMDGTGESYILPLTYQAADKAGDTIEELSRMMVARVKIRSSGEEGFIVDGLLQPEFCTALLNMIATRQGIKGKYGRLSATPTHGMKSIYNKLEAPLETTVVKAEQSNTSIIYGHSFILKLFRRLQDGINPDLEIGRFLTRKRFPNLPPVNGYLEYGGKGEEPNTVAILQTFIPNQGDAWQYTLNSLYSYFEQILEIQDEQPPPPRQETLLELGHVAIPPESGKRIGFYLESTRLLAMRTAEMHQALASENIDPLFSPESFSKLYQRSLFQSMSSQANQVLSQFKKQLRRMPQDVRKMGESFLERQGDIIARFRLLTDRKISAKRLRCHGDFHLGQVLHTGNDFVIIDFEGEPARPVSERRIKRSPLRDVAGMLRSFHYAIYSALRDEEGRGSFHEDDREKMEAWAEEWRMWVSAEYLYTYLNHSADSRFLPETSAEIQVLLDAYLLEKAIYELGYEMNNRPEWIHIPLHGIEQLLDSR